MTETVEQPAADVAAPVAPAKKGKASPKKKTATKASAKKASHPPCSQMVTAAIKDLKERNGSSLQAIKKYISTTFKVDTDKMSLFIRKYIKAAVESGELVQTKGKGAAGSFKLGGGETSQKKVTAKPKARKAAPKKSPKKAPPKKTKPAAPATPEKKKETVVPAPKAKKSKKPPTSPKAPKPKKAAATAKAKKPTAAATKSKAKKPAAKKAPAKKK